MNLRLISPELFQLLIVAGLFVQSILQGDRSAPLKKWLPWAAGLGVLVSMASLSQNGLMFGQTYQVDRLSQFFKMTVSLGFFLTVITVSANRCWRRRNGVIISCSWPFPPGD